jgi:hypothetical protein
MATNPWVSQSVRGEQNLYEDLVNYLPRELVNVDKVFLDDVPSRFSDAYKIEMYVENTEGFGGEGDLFSKFGVELRDQATFITARRRWKSLIGDKLDSYNFRPREGDIIYIPFSQSMFEIFKVETETPFYQLNQLPTYRLQCELFEYNDEDFDTDIEGIDDVEVESAYQYKLVMESPATATANATTLINLDGEVTQFQVSFSGKGYVTAPTITIEAALGSNSKFGNASLDVGRGRGVETSYTQTGLHGVIEAWIYIDNLPSTGQSVFFETGGNDDNLPAQYFWGVNSNGQLVYSRGDNAGGGITSLTGNNILFQENTWHHILIGAFDTNNLVIYFDFEKKFDDNLAGVTFDWVSDNGFSIGATAARTVDGVDWSGMNGFIDEFRVQVGTKAELLEPRYTVVGVDTVISTTTSAYVEESADAALYHFDAVSATATSTIDSDGVIDSLILNQSGIYYNEPPAVTISVPYGSNDYKRGEIVTQLGSGYSMTGEVAKWSDSDNTLYLTHVGATDGKYHTFNTTRAVVSPSATYAPSLVEELQQIEEVSAGISQNNYFDDFESDFLDFSEGNPFGDMS